MFALEEGGNCRHDYNLTRKRGGYGYTTNFDWMMEATPENMELINSEIERLAFDEVSG